MNLSIKQPTAGAEILIRYGKLSSNARDRVLDQFYLMAPNGSSMSTYLLRQISSIVFGIMGFCLLLSTFDPILTHVFKLKAGSTFAAMPFLLLFFELIFFGAIIYNKRHRYWKRYKEPLMVPTEVGLSAERICLHFRTIHGGRIRSSLRWSEITSARLSEEEETGGGRVLVLCGRSGSGRADPVRSIKLKLDYIQTIEERQLLKEFLLHYLNHLEVRQIARDLVRMGSAGDLPFTRLWCLALKDSRPRVETELLEEGRLLQDGRFEIRRCIGGGGQGTVYEAMMKEIDSASPVALKEYILPDVEHTLEHKAACEQFEKEIRLLGRIKHEGVIRLLDAFVEDHRAYLVIDHIDGLSLRRLVERSGPLSREEAVEIGIEMCSVLEHLHSMTPRIMHLDFSPENILRLADDAGTFDSECRIRVIDFNISAEENAVRTRTVMGKQRYMAPEQYRGRPTPASDLYAAGATLYFLLTGQEPEPISTSRLNSLTEQRFDKALDALVRRATSMEEEDRFASAKEMKEALEDVLAASRSAR